MEDVEGIFRESGAVLDGHFLLTSGLHSPQYWEKFRILEKPWLTERLCHLIAEHFRDRGVETVAGPTVGGMVLAFEVGRQLGVRSIYAEREGAGRTFRRGFVLRPGERVLVVDDILTTGGSLRDVMIAVEKVGGSVVGAGVLVDRSRGHVDLGVPFFSCLAVSVPTYPPEACPLCRAGLPLVRLGSGGLS